LTADNFDFGLRLDFTNIKTQPDVFQNLDQYLDLIVTQNVFQWVKDPATGNTVKNRTKIR